MSKKKTEANDTQPNYVVELLTKGTTVLTAASRDELAEMVNSIQADCSYGTGAVGYNAETGLFSLRIDIINDNTENYGNT